MSVPSNILSSLVCEHLFTVLNYDFKLSGIFRIRFVSDHTSLNGMFDFRAFYYCFFLDKIYLIVFFQSILSTNEFQKRNR